MCFVLAYFVAEVESEPEVEDKSEDSNHPRDSGCFESSENLEGGREEGNKEGPLEEREKEEQVEEGQQQEEEQKQQLDAVQQQLEELTLVEGSWGPEGNNGLETCAAAASAVTGWWYRCMLANSTNSLHLV